MREIKSATRVHDWGRYQGPSCTAFLAWHKKVNERLCKVWLDVDAKSGRPLWYATGIGTAAIGHVNLTNTLEARQTHCDPWGPGSEVQRATKPEMKRCNPQRLRSHAKPTKRNVALKKKIGSSKTILLIYA